MTQERSVDPFSPGGRRAALADLAARPPDVLVIGGGITGCGVARDAALRGLETGLIEKADFAFGTSGRSSKIVHGGIRYLAYGHVPLVRESARERKVLLAIAPHLVHPLPFVYPLYAGQSMTKFRGGFWLFDRLAEATRAERHRVLKPDEVRRAAPAIRDPLKGGVVYGEYLTDDARLTLENALCAARHGARVANHAEAVGLLRAGRGGRISGARVRDRLSGQEFEVSARVVVNATGVWAGEVLGLGGAGPPKPIVTSKGIHLLFRAERLPLTGALHLRSPGGREGLAIRRWDYVYVGTSDVEYHGAFDGAVADEAAVEDVLRLARDCFPGLDLGGSDILATWAGLRPLVGQDGRSTREMSRHDEIWEGPEGLVTIAGGKLTTYRAMADRVLQRVMVALGREPGDNRRTAEVLLPGAGEAGAGGSEHRDALERELRRRGVPEAAAARILWLYGAGTAELLRYGAEDPAWLAPLAPGVAAVRGEARLAVEREMAGALADFMDRRAALLLFSDDRGLAAAPAAADIMAEGLGWDERERAAQLESYRRLARAHGLPGAER